MCFRFRLVFLALLSTVATGCSINHHIADDYGGYLEKNSSENAIPTTDISAEYYLSEKTENHSYRFRAATVGSANVWIVEFGKILDETMASDEIRESFKSIAKSDANSNAMNLIEFDLIDYEFYDYKADINLSILYKSNGQTSIVKQYHATGLPQTTQMWLGGVFGMRDAIHDSMKSAVDQILTELLIDINEYHNSDLNQNPDLYTELLKLEDLKQRGILSDEEFAEQKRKLLESD